MFHTDYCYFKIDVVRKIADPSILVQYHLTTSCFCSVPFVARQLDCFLNLLTPSLTDQTQATASIYLCFCFFNMENVFSTLVFFYWEFTNNSVKQRFLVFTSTSPGDFSRASKRPSESWRSKKRPNKNRLRLGVGQKRIPKNPIGIYR